jgi:TolB protein
VRRQLTTLLATGVLAALVALAMSACGERRGQENKKSASGGSAATNGQIVFRRYFNADQTKGALFTMNPDGSHLRQITHPPKDWPQDDGPAWSPDGERVAFHRETIDHSTGRIMVVDPDTGDTREITRCTGRCLGDLEPAFSPDGDSLAFNRLVGPPFLKGETRPYKISWPEWKNYGAIFIVGLDGSAPPHQVTNVDPKLRVGHLATEDTGPAFSPDGKTLVFDRIRYPEDRHAVFVQPIGSSQDAQQITPWNLNCQDHPEFSPDGKLVLFRCLPEGEEGPSNLYWVHPNGTGLHPLTQAPADKQYLGSSFSPSFSGGRVG